MVVLMAGAVLNMSGASKVDKISADVLNHLQAKRAPMHSFYDLKQGLQVHVVPTTPTEQTSKKVIHLSGSNAFVAPTVNYVRAMGFREIDLRSDYQLYITIHRADVDLKDKGDVMELDVTLKDSHGSLVFFQGGISATAFSSMQAGSKKKEYGLVEAYTRVLESIDWYRIASSLKAQQELLEAQKLEAERQEVQKLKAELLEEQQKRKALPKEEPTKQVQGYGDTALEQTIVRWDVQSRPQGADLFWRVVSTTPEVKSTNNKYLMTTPYEASKTLDIRGLTYQAAGNVRIILRCEKEGYMPQEKEFNARMVLDQEEISAFFRMVKEEPNEE